MYNWLVLHILRSIFLLIHWIRPPQPVLPIDLNKVHRVLLVITTAVGDTLMCTPAVRSVRKALPNAKISVLVDRRRIALLSENPHVDQIIVYPGKFKRLNRLLKELKSVAADLAIILYANDPDIVPLVYLSGAPVRIGWAESRFAFLLTHPAPKPEGNVHFIEHRGRMIEAAGISLDSMQMELYPLKKDQAYIDHFLRKQQMDPDTRLIALHPFGSILSKWWPEENVIGLLDAFRNHPDFKVVLLGSKDEKKAIDRILARSHENVQQTGQLDIGKIAALLNRAKLFIGTDSGPMHMAAALNIPRIELFGPTIPEMYSSENGKVIRLQSPVDCFRPCRKKTCEDPKCMKEILPETVYSSVLKLMNTNQ
jgi:lipopolysaccharide heptosyltransferase II